MIRVIIYAALVVVVIIATNLKIGVIQEKRNAPTISILNEYNQHGKPVEIYTVKKEALHFFERVTGQFSQGVIDLYVSKLQWNDIKIGQLARAVNAGEGTVIATSNEMDTSTGLYLVKVRVNSPAQFKNGQSVVVDINTKTISNILIVPSTAIEWEGKEAYLWVLENAQASRKQVKAGEQSEMFTQIVSGLVPSEKVIVRGASALEKGDKVRIVSSGEVK